MKNLTLLAMLLVLMSCKNEPAENDLKATRENLTVKNVTQPSGEGSAKTEEKAVAMIRAFYTEYITANLEDISPENNAKIERIKKRYITKAALNKLANMDVYADPFVNAQDYTAEMITDLTITKTGKDTYNACPHVMEVPLCCKLTVIIQNGVYKINDFEANP